MQGNRRGHGSHPAATAFPLYFTSQSWPFHTWLVAFCSREVAFSTRLLTIDGSMSDEAGHQLPNFSYPGLTHADLMEWVERFYGEYFFRPRVAWRIVRKAMFDSNDRKRLYKEAREYMALRSKRKKFVAANRTSGQAEPVTAGGSGD